VPPNYSQVLQASAPTDVQMDIDWERNRVGQFPSLPKPQLPRATMASMVTIPHGANWMPTKEIRPTVGLQGGARGNMMLWVSAPNIGTEGELNQYIAAAHISGSWAVYLNMCTYCQKRHGVQCRTPHWSNGRHQIGCQQRQGCSQGRATQTHPRPQTHQKTVQDGCEDIPGKQ